MHAGRGLRFLGSALISNLSIGRDCPSKSDRSALRGLEIFLIIFQDRVTHVTQTRLLKNFDDRIRLEKNEHFPDILPPSSTENAVHNFFPYLVSSIEGGDDVQRNTQPGLHRQEISHPQQATVNCGGMLDLKGMYNPATMQPEHVNILNSLNRRGVEVDGKSRRMLPACSLGISSCTLVRSLGQS